MVLPLQWLFTEAIERSPRAYIYIYIYKLVKQVKDISNLVPLVEYGFFCFCFLVILPRVFRLVF